jgi:hypothetical protein
MVNCLYRVSEDYLKRLYSLIVGSILTQMVANGNNDLDFNNLTVFDSQNIPGINITDYIARIMAYSRASSRNIVMALSYIDTLSNDEECPVNFTRFSAHRLI